MLLGLPDLEQHLVGFVVPDFEVDEFDVVDVGGERAEVLVGGLGE